MEVTLVVAMTVQRYRLDLMPGQTVKVPQGDPATTSGSVDDAAQHHQQRRDLTVENQAKAPCTLPIGSSQVEPESASRSTTHHFGTVVRSGPGAPTKSLFRNHREHGFNRRNTTR